MEPNKFEKGIIEKLNSREIKPSDQSWDRLNVMLSMQEEKEKKNVFPWLKIAAVFVLSLGLGLFFFIPNNESQDWNKTPISFQENKEVRAEKEELKNVVISAKSQVKSFTNQQSETINKEIIAGTKTKEKKANFFVKSKVTQESQTMTQLALVVNEKNKNIEVKDDKQISEQDDNQEVVVNQNFSKPVLKIDAAALLNQVEGEVTLTFRQKIMRTIKKNYEETKIAISNRNQESSK